LVPLLQLWSGEAGVAQQIEKAAHEPAFHRTDPRQLAKRGQPGAAMLPKLLESALDNRWRGEPAARGAVECICCLVRARWRAVQRRCAWPTCSAARRRSPCRVRRSYVSM